MSPELLASAPLTCSETPRLFPSVALQYLQIFVPSPLPKRKWLYFSCWEPSFNCVFPILINIDLGDIPVLDYRFPQPSWPVEYTLHSRHSCLQGHRFVSIILCHFSPLASEHNQVLCLWFLLPYWRERKRHLVFPPTIGRSPKLTI